LRPIGVIYLQKWTLYVNTYRMSPVFSEDIDPKTAGELWNELGSYLNTVAEYSDAKFANEKAQVLFEKSTVQTILRWPEHSITLALSCKT